MLKKFRKTVITKQTRHSEGFSPKNLIDEEKNKSLRREDVKAISSLTNLGLAMFPRPLWKRVRERGFKKAAFTLAEVLITLGVIGVVAAMTIPDLVKKYQYTAWTKQLQKSYATLNQGFRRMLADDGASLLSQTETFNSIGGTEYNSVNGAKYKRCYSIEAIDGAECKEFLTNLGKYFKIASIETFTSNNKYTIYTLAGNLYYNSYSGTVITLMDETMIWGFVFYSQNPDNNTNNTMKGLVGNFYLDINGLKRPNKFGRDIFVFYLGDNGIVYPYGSMAVAEYMVSAYQGYSIADAYWKTAKSGPWVDSSCATGEQGLGWACGARVLETGKMDYAEGANKIGS